MRTELQYNLQKARALATELRCTLETIKEIAGETFEDEYVAEDLANDAGGIEGWLDDMAADLIGEGSVALKIEENV